MSSVPKARSRRSVVVILSAEHFDRLEEHATAHGHDPYLHAHWLLAQALGLTMPSSPELSAQNAEAER